MNQQQILGELTVMRERFEHYERLNAPTPVAYAYWVATRNVSRLIEQVMAEGVEIDDE